MLEFALALPVFLLVVLGIVTFGHLMFVYVLADTGAREGSRYGAAAGMNEAGVEHYRDCDGVIDAVLRNAAAAGVIGTSVSINYDNGPGSSTIGACEAGAVGPELDLGNRIVVSIDVLYQPLFPLLDIQEFPIRVTSARTIIKNVIYGTPLNSPTPYVPPTSTFTPTATVPTNTPTATHGPKPKDTDTPTPTASPTASPTATATPTSTPVDAICPGFHAGFTSEGKSITGLEFDVTNNDTRYAINLVRVYLKWPGSARLRQIQMDSGGVSPVWTDAVGGDSPFTVCDSGCSASWQNTSTNGRQIPPSETRSVKFLFTSSLPKGNVNVVLGFNNACDINLNSSP